MAEKVKFLPVVNKNDRIIGYKKRDEINTRDIYRMTGLWVTADTGEILLAKRALFKKKDPGKLGPAVAGTVEQGESYSTNIIKEAREEIGLTHKRFTKGKKQRFHGEHNAFCQWYCITLKKEYRLKINKEVDKVKWITKDKLIKETQERPDRFIQNMGTIRQLTGKRLHYQHS